MHIEFDGCHALIYTSDEFLVDPACFLNVVIIVREEKPYSMESI